MKNILLLAAFAIFAFGAFSAPAMAKCSDCPGKEVACKCIKGEPCKCAEGECKCDQAKMEKCAKGEKNNKPCLCSDKKKMERGHISHGNYNN